MAKDEKKTGGWFLIILVVVIVIVVLVIGWYYRRPIHRVYRRLQKEHQGSEDEGEDEVEDSLEGSTIDHYLLGGPDRPSRERGGGERKWKREEACRKILEDIYKVPFKKDHPEFLRSPESNRKLELDGYNADLKIAFEHNGRQHYQYPNHFHQDEKEFLRQVRNDRFKQKRCLRHQVYLITIPYTVPLKELRSFIISKLPRDESSEMEPSTISWIEET